jgi:putative nucleotidyltransferase with HDIG domain
MAAVATFDAGAVRVRILRLFASPTYRPPRLPQVALDILALSRRSQVEFDEVVALLERDPILAAKVLSLCQSAAYARGAPVRSLRQAVVRLGFAGLRDLVVEAAVHLRVFRVPGYEQPMARLARHSTVVARLMPALCGVARVDTEYAFLCGLLHDVGIAAALLALSDDARGGAVPFAAGAEVIDGLHEEASGLLARLWDLPPDVQRVLASHHRVEHGGTPSAVNAALLVAEALAREVDAGVTPRGAETTIDGAIEGEVAAALAFLRLDDATMGTLRAVAARVSAGLSAEPDGKPAPPRGERSHDAAIPADDTGAPRG